MRKLASEIGKEVREWCSGGRGGGSFVKEGENNRVRSATESSQMRTDHSRYYCPHSWYYWFNIFIIYQICICVSVCVCELSLLSHWSVHPSGTIWPLKLSYSTTQASCLPPPFFFFSLQEYPGYSNLKFVRILDWNFIKSLCSPNALEILFYIFLAYKLVWWELYWVCLSSLHSLCASFICFTNLSRFFFHIVSCVSS